MIAHTASDYSDIDNWMAIPEITKKVDAFYLYPTSFIDASDGAPDICEIGYEPMRTLARQRYDAQARVFEESCNVFAPYYRQSNIAHVGKLPEDELLAFQHGPQRSDVFAALDYYFEHLNRDRPYFLAGHSQGSIMIRIVLEEYMRIHPEVYSRMIAAYAIGFPITRKSLTDNPHIRFAQREDDTGVVVSWNTEGPANKGHRSVVVAEGMLCINPLNWSLDDVTASVDENLGSRMPDSEGRLHSTPGLADARVDPVRGVLVCTTYDEYIPMAEYFGPASLHNGDYGLYYENLRRNIIVRARSFLAKEFLSS